MGTLEKAFDFLLNNNHSLTKPTQTQINEYKAQTLATIKQKYPALGIQ